MSQTCINCGKSIKRKRTTGRCVDCDLAEYWRWWRNAFPRTLATTQRECRLCGAAITEAATTGMCKTCARRERRLPRALGGTREPLRVKTRSRLDEFRTLVSSYGDPL